MSAVDRLKKQRGYRRASGRMGGGGAVVTKKAWQKPVIQGHHRPHVIRSASKKDMNDAFNQQAPDPLTKGS